MSTGNPTAAAAPPAEETAEQRQGFTLLEVIVALAILAISVLVLIDSQSQAVYMRQQGEEMVVGTMLARDIMTLVELRMEKEGFGELTITEKGEFKEEEYLDAFEEYRWEYDVSRVELDLDRILSMASELMGMAEDEGAVEDENMLTGGFDLSSLGIDPSMFTEELSRYVREIRVRVYWCGEQGSRDEGACGPDEVTLVTHIVNPTGRTTSAEEQEIGGLGGIGGLGSGAVEGSTSSSGSGSGSSPMSTPASSGGSRSSGSRAGDSSGGGGRK